MISTYANNLSDFRLNYLVPKRREGIVSVLDVGSSKVACLIAKLTRADQSPMFRHRTHDVAILGYGVQCAYGVKSGTIVDMQSAERSIKLAIDAAERMAGITIDSIIVNLTSGHIRSEIFRATTKINGQTVIDTDIERAMSAIANCSTTGDRIVLHSLPVSYGVDNSTGISDPCGMLANKVSVDAHVVTANLDTLRNIELVINRSYLEVDAVVSSPYASALATIMEDECKLGVACVDMGGGTTSVAVLVDGQLVHTAVFTIGGQHITMDLAQGLSTRIENAERIKILHGSALMMHGIAKEEVQIPDIGSDYRDIISIPQSSIAKIIRPRIDEILELVRDSITSSGFGGRASRRVILTGGASQLTGLVDVARGTLGPDVRLGRPLGIHNSPRQTKTSAFATSIGMLIYPQLTNCIQHKKHSKSASGGYFSHFREWIKESLSNGF